MIWTVKHAPKSVDEIAGNDEAKAHAKKWALDWARGKRQKPLLVSGPSGSGKTALVRAIAIEFGWILVESGSSDVRDEKRLSKQFGLGTTGGLWGTRLLFIDDLDSVFDRGEVPALLELLSSASQPTILCANDVWDPKLSKIRSECARVELKKINKAEVRRVLQGICEKEKLGVGKEKIDEIVEACGGDLRAAIIDLQSGFVSEREGKEDVFKTLSSLFKGSFDGALKLEPEDFDLFYWWIEENIPAEYESNEEIAQAYGWLSKADVFKGRISKRQDWGLQKFVRALALGGVASAKKTPYRKFSRYQFPSIIRMLGSSKGARGMVKEISLKAAAGMHCSSRQAFSSLLLLPPSSWESLGLNEEEKSFLKELQDERSNAK
ncbi:MAG: AAA family ATPase [Candidatus Norongarragalinales archaeon]